MATKYFATTCEFTLHEDDWNEGEGKLLSVWDEADCIKASDTIKGVLEQVNYLDDDYEGKRPVAEVFENDPCEDKEHSLFEADLLVDHDGEHIIRPSAEKYKQFECGVVKLYALHITVVIKKQSELDEDDVRCWKD